MVPAMPLEPRQSDDAQGVLEHASSLMPWAISITFHVGVLLILMLLIWLPPMQAPPDDTLIVPVVSPNPTEHPGAKRVEKKFDQAEGPRKQDLNRPAPDVADRTPGPVNPNTALAVFGDKDPAGGGGLEGLTFGGGGGGWGFFGPDDPNARRIVYVVDKSGSMAGSFDYVQAELKRSISKLTVHQQFHVIFFADGIPYELKVNGRTGLQPATANAKRSAEPWIDAMIAESRGGSTDPSRSLERAFQVAGGPPDLIYLLTDGLFPTEVMDRIDRLNAGRKVRVNTIMFKDRLPEAEKMLRRIAAENGGVYRFISEEQLGTEY